MNEVQFIKHRIFRETDAVVFYDISVEESNAADLVIHDGPATSPPDDCVGANNSIFIVSKMTIIELCQVREHLNWLIIVGSVLII